MTFRKAPAHIAAMMRIMGHQFLAWPPDTVYYLYVKPAPHMIRHEQKHLEQMKRDGIVTYFRRWWSQYFRLGYNNIDYEIEARQAELRT